jgi:hypothetical protein
MLKLPQKSKEAHENYMNTTLRSRNNYERMLLLDLALVLGNPSRIKTLNGEGEPLGTEDIS